MLLVAFAVSTYFIGEYNRILAVVMAVAILFFVLYSNKVAKNRAARILDYLERMSDGLDSTVRDTPLPVVIFNSETQEILWSNDRFISITELREPLFELRISDAAPDFCVDWLLDGKTESPELVLVGGRKFRVFGSMMLSEHEYIATTYWVDVTESAKISDEYYDSRPIFAIITLDNYEELVKGLSEKEKSSLLSDIDDKITVWTGESGGYLCRFDRDRYFFLFEERKLNGFMQDNFSLLDSVRTSIGARGVCATLSVGIGKDGATPYENYRFAGLGVEMALSRGGDQAVIRNKYGFEFFGGHSPQYESRTKVKSRIMANALGELLSDASTVFIMGHSSADYDSVGAAVGIACIARAKKIKARIVIDLENNHAGKLIELFRSVQEYSEVFTSEKNAILEADAKSLLVVVDTTRPDMVQSRSLLLSCTRVAVIDHHRRAADYIDNAAFNFHEPQASSTSELVTEMIQYLVDIKNVLKVEAEALLVGMALDTKGFVINTGSRTFEAAAYMRRAGADAATIKMLLQTDIETAISRYAIMKNAEIYREGIVIASSDSSQSKVSIAQAADELLNIEGVNTSFAAAHDGASVFMSGRSTGIVNVQVILEKLGGGGSRLTAALQLHDTSMNQVLSDLKKVIDEYLEQEAKRAVKS